MRIVYSICSSADWGIGAIANQAVAGLKAGGHKVLHWNSQFLGQGISDIDFDKRIALRLENTSCHVLHVWANSGLETMQVANDRGIPRILERASTHVDHQKRVIEEEFSGVVIPDDVLNRMRHEYELASIILTPSEYAANTFPEHLQEKIKMVPFGVDTEMFKPNLTQKHEGFRVLFVGANHLRKGGRYLEEAWKDLDEVELWTTGSNFMTGENVKSLGLVKHEEMPRLMNACDVLVLPSLEEGNAICIGEMLSCGKPVIITEECGPWPDWKDTKHGILIPSKNPVAIADDVKYLRDSPAKAKKMGRAGRKLALKHSWEIYGEELCQIHQKL